MKKKRLEPRIGERGGGGRDEELVPRLPWQGGQGQSTRKQHKGKLKGEKRG